MITYHVGYEAENQYDHEVQEAYFQFLVRPCTDDTQDIISEKMECSHDCSIFKNHNSFGYTRLSVRVAQAFSYFRFRIDCQVRKSTEDPLQRFTKPLSLQDELQLLESEAFQVDNYLFIRQTPLSDLILNQVPASMRYRRNVPMLNYLQELNGHIYDFMEYKAQVTTIYTSAKDILNKPVGVCQDYTHLMLGVLRSQQIPARYVSGYLNQGKEFIGAARMHAWVEVCLPGQGWLGLDPTNRILADHHYIKVADGLDFEDCSPLRGHIKPAGINCTDHSVQVVEQ